MSIRTSLRRPLLAATTVVLVAAGTSACGGGGGGGTPLTLASQNFPEAVLVSALYDQLLSAHGFDVTEKLVDTRDSYMKIFPSDVDVVPEYVAGIGDFLNTEKNGENATAISNSSTDETLAKVKPLAAADGITLLDPSKANSQNGFFVSKDYSQTNDVTKLSDLSGKSIVLAASPDCKGRSDCETGLEDTYGIKITKLLPLGFASPQSYKSVQDGESQLGETDTIDPNLDAEGLVLLQDDKGIQPAQNLIPAVSTSYLKANPKIEKLLDDLMADLDNSTLDDLLDKVTNDREKASDVAESFLKDKGLI